MGENRADQAPTGGDELQPRRHSRAVLLALTLTGISVFILVATPSGRAAFFALLGMVLARGLVHSASNVYVARSRTDAAAADPSQWLTPPIQVGFWLIVTVALLILLPTARTSMSWSLGMAIVGQFVWAIILVLSQRRHQTDDASRDAAFGTDLLRDSAFAVLSLFRACLESVKSRGTRLPTLIGISLSILLPLTVPLLWSPDFTAASQLDFGVRQDDLDLTLSARRAGRIPWKIDIVPKEAKKWLSVAPDKGSANSDVAVHVHVERSELACSKESARLVVRGTTLRATSVLVGVDNEASAVFSSEGRDLAAEGLVIVGADRCAFTVTNRGGSLLYTKYQAVDLEGEDRTRADELARCILVEPLGSSPCGPGAEQPVRVSWTSLPRRTGPYRGHLRFRCTCHGRLLPDVLIPFTILYTPPEISLDGKPGLVSPVAAGVAQVGFTIKNTGTVTAVWWADESEFPAWLSHLSALSGRIVAEGAQPVEATVALCQLPVSEQTPSIAIHVQNGEDLAVPISLQPTPASLAVTPTFLRIGGDAPLGSITVSNQGCGPLEWSATWTDVEADDDNGSGTPRWIACLTRETDVIGGFGEASVNILVNRDAVASGSHSATLKVTHDGSPDDYKTVAVCVEGVDPTPWHVDYQLIPCAAPGSGPFWSGPGLGVGMRFPSCDIAATLSWPRAQQGVSCSLALSVGSRHPVLGGDLRLALCAAVTGGGAGDASAALEVCAGVAAEYETLRLQFGSRCVSLGVCISAGYSLRERFWQSGLGFCIHLVRPWRWDL